MVISSRSFNESYSGLLQTSSRYRIMVLKKRGFHPLEKANITPLVAWKAWMRKERIIFYDHYRGSENSI